ncbi:hypothetical protein ACP70R_000356 [Stipagrostis hirtigluma subsp. patula]
MGDPAAHLDTAAVRAAFVSSVTWARAATKVPSPLLLPLGFAGEGDLDPLFGSLNAADLPLQPSGEKPRDKPSGEGDADDARRREVEEEGERSGDRGASHGLRLRLRLRLLRRELHRRRRRHAARRRRRVLSERDIHQCLSQEAAATAEAFSVPVDRALALLCHYRWSRYRLQDDWFDEQGRVRAAAGLGDDDDAVEAVTTATCGICLEDRPAAEMASAGCTHRYCDACWRGYVAAAVDGGPRCLTLRCPDASCSRAVLRGMVERFATSDGRRAYARHLARAYVEAHDFRLKQCTAAGCGCAIEIAPGSGDGDLLCRCGNAFCWRCGGAPHWPASCAAVARWARAADAASEDWILLKTKPNDMECAPPCGHNFCWACLGPRIFPDYDNSHSGCLDYGAPEPETEERKRARRALDLFLRHHGLWAANVAARRSAERELRRLRDKPAACVLHAWGGRDAAASVAAAWEQVAEGRRVLGNACAHGLSLRERADAAVRWELFEHQHGQADDALARLQRRAEAACKGKAASVEEYYRGRRELDMLTQVTRQCIENFAKAVEEARLPEVPLPASTSKGDSPEN